MKSLDNVMTLPVSRLHEVSVDLTKTRAGRLLALMAGLLGIVLLAYQWYRVTISAVNVPRYDAWNLIADTAWTHNLSWSWLVSFHNEHRILPSRALTWSLYRLNNWNVAIETAVAHGIYAATCVYVVLALNRRCKTRAAFFFLPMFATTLAYENQLSGFQTCFHFTVLFFFLALDLALRRDRYSWLAAPCALLSAYALASGLALACSFIGLIVTQAWVFPKERVRAAFCVTATTLGIACWFLGRVPWQPSSTLPWKPGYWSYLSNLISLGFGHVQPHFTPGMVVLSLAFLGIVGLAMQSRQKSNEEFCVDGFVIFALCGFLLALAAVTFGRAASGVDQAKSPRYAELSMFVVPLIWLILQRTTSPIINAKLGRIAMAILLVSLWWPMKSQFNYAPYVTYQSAGKAGQACMISSLRAGDAKITCPELFPSPMPRAWRDNAVAAQFSFMNDEKK